MPNKMRLPNGFGQISKINNKKLRNPYRVMVTVGKSDTGKYVRKLLKPTAYFPTYNDAYQALMEYNRNPYDLSDDLTVEQLYERWSEHYFAKLKNQSSVRTIKSSWTRCSTIYKMRIRDLRSRHIKGCIDEGKTPNIKSRIKSMFNNMLDYALEYELVDKNYARTFSLDKEIVRDLEKSRTNHKSFTDDDMKILWENITYPYVDAILIQCYMGWRPQELGLIKLVDVDLEQNIIRGGMKTDAGTDRIVPIHTCIRDLVKKRQSMSISLGSEYLFNTPESNGLFLTYDKYRTRFMNAVRDLKLDPDHRAHDPRKQFVTMCKKYNVDEYAIKYMAGHAISDVTEKVYTDREIDWLKEEIEKIKPM